MHERSDHMSIYLEYLDFILGIIGFLITIGTLRTAISVKKHVIQNAEQQSFRQQNTEIISRISGYINSINEDKIYSTDNNRSFQPELSQFLIDLKTQFTFLSKNSRKPIESLHRLLNKSDLTSNDWNRIAELLITLRNMLKKEDFYHG